MFAITVPTTVAPGSSPRRARSRASDQHHVIARQHRAGLVDEERAIGVAVERDADDRTVRPRDLLAYARLQRREMRRPARDVDAAAVVLAVQRDDARAEPLEDLRSDEIRCSERAVDDDGEPAQIAAGGDELREVVVDQPARLRDDADVEPGRAAEDRATRAAFRSRPRRRRRA